jgi:hypothetical protein
LRERERERERERNRQNSFNIVLLVTFSFIATINNYLLLDLSVNSISIEEIIFIMTSSMNKSIIDVPNKDEQTY